MLSTNYAIITAFLCEKKLEVNEPWVVESSVRWRDDRGNGGRHHGKPKMKVEGNE